jgi:hypothetical protein
MRFVEIPGIEIGDYYNKRIPICIKDNKKPVKVQIPRMYMPFGISEFVPEVGTPKYNIDFSMKGWDEDGNYVQKFYEFVRSVENAVKAKVSEQSTQIFGQNVPDTAIDAMFNSNIKTSGDREPKFRVKIDETAMIFDVNQTEITSAYENGLYGQHSGVCMVEITGVYFLNKMFGITWKVNQLKVYEPQRLKGFHFQLDEDEPDY